MKDDIKNGHFYESVKGLVDHMVVEAEKGGDADMKRIHSLRDVVIGVVHKTHDKFEAIFNEVENLKEEIAMEALDELSESAGEVSESDRIRLKSYYGALNKILKIIRHDTDLAPETSSKNADQKFNPMENPLMKFVSEAQFLYFKNNLKGLHLADIIGEVDFNNFMDAYFVYPNKKAVPLKQQIEVDEANKSEIISLFYRVTLGWNHANESEQVAKYMIPQVICHAFSCFTPNYSTIRNIYTKMNSLATGTPKTKPHFEKIY